MIKVNNKKAIHNIAIKSFSANKTRNNILVIAIALTTILFTSLFTIGIGMTKSFQQETMRQSGGSDHASLKYLTDNQFNIVKENDAVKEIGYARFLCDDIENEELLKHRSEFWYYDDIALKHGFIKLDKGHKPQAENEVIVDSMTLKALGVPLKLGETVSLKLNIRHEEVTRDFILSGWWESDPAINVGQIFSSRTYVDAHIDELQCNYYEDYIMTGAISARVNFSNSMNLQKKLDKLIIECGFSSVSTDENYVASGVNWAYLSTNFGMDMETILGLGCGLLLIIFTGYLIIYNIFQISIVSDIRFYGLLKTIGTTAKQLRRIIHRQALILSVIGIPIGLVIGFFFGKALIPFIINNGGYSCSTVSVSPTPIIFIGSSVFALITVYISTLKPGRMAGRVSPIEAVRYTECDRPKHGHKKSLNGAKMARMAMSNVGRNKKRTVLVIISLSLSIVLLNTVLTLSKSIDMDKFVSTFNDTDFLVAHADYFNCNFRGVGTETSQQMISSVKALDGFEQGGRLYCEKCFRVTDLNNTDITKFNCVNEAGDFGTYLYGLESLPMQRLELLDGEMDMEKLLSGDYILEGVGLDDNSNADWETAHFKVGETIKLHNYIYNNGKREYITHNYTVLGHVAMKHFSNTCRSYIGYDFYLPAEAYKNIVPNPAVMSYAFNIADDKQADVERFLKQYTEDVEPMMDYDSKATTVELFEGMRKTFLTVGGALGGIIGLIGFLNFINAMITSIIARRKEFAMLQSIGMTKKQLKKMLCYEGLSYAILSSAFSLVFGILLSLVIVKSICGLMWFLSYHIIVWPILIAILVLLILGIAVPLVIYGATDKQSIVERLREVE